MVVIRGPYNISTPLVGSWATEHRRLYGTMSTAQGSPQRREDTCEGPVEPTVGEAGLVSMGALQRVDHINLTLNARTLFRFVSPDSSSEGDCLFDIYLLHGLHDVYRTTVCVHVLVHSSEAGM